MGKMTIKGIHELYRKDPLAADEIVFGRTSDPGTRRGFLRTAGLATLGAILGANIVHAETYPAGMIPAALLDPEVDFRIPGKHPDLVILNDRPLNAETPAHLLDDKVTSADLLFVRNNGIPPLKQEIDLASWKLSISGESASSEKTYTLAELKSRFEHHTYQLTIECGGNGRAEFQPPAKGNQWTTGAVGCPSWTGVRLRDVLEDVGVSADAVYIGYYGKDVHLSGQPGKPSISRGVPIAKAMENESLIAWSINGQDLPIENGYPLRLVFGGWPASCSGKWLEQIVIRNKVHDGPKMEGQSYRVPCEPVSPGTTVADEDMCIIESMPVKSLITYPRSGAMLDQSQALEVRGHAWAGDQKVARMDVSVDFGATWQECELSNPVNRHAWQHFSTSIRFPEKGYYEVWARATDDKGVSQPMLVPGWNPKGYLNNACHRIAVKVL